jgi:hypothetical protein
MRMGLPHHQSQVCSGSFSEVKARIGEVRSPRVNGQWATLLDTAKTHNTVPQTDPRCRRARKSLTQQNTMDLDRSEDLDWSMDGADPWDFC